MNNARFLASALDESSYPRAIGPSGKPLPEIAFVGRSNVGKSSLINHLLKTEKLARTSSMPGRTQLLNFFSIDDQWVFVDLPGYGYAMASKQKQETWSKGIEVYLQTRQNLTCIFLLLDIRRTSTEKEIELVNWLKHFKKRFVIVFTKCDEVSDKEKATQAEAVLQILNTDAPFFFYSIKEKSGRDALTKFIKTIRN